MVKNNLEESAKSVDRVVFRVDCSQNIGMGHIMRCLALADGFERAGIKTIFIIKECKKRVIQAIRNNNHFVEILFGKLSFKEDAILTLDIVSRYKAPVIITDLSNVETLADAEGYGEYIRTLKESGRYVATIDGMGEDCISKKTVVPADIIIAPYFGAEKKRCEFRDHANTLLGPRYFMFRREFITAAGHPKNIKESAANILISMGGSDPFNLTIKTAKALTRLNKPDLKLKAVFGPGFSSSCMHETQVVLKKFKGEYDIIVESGDMAELMLWADLAVISSGLTVYEAAITGTPSIVLSQYDYHVELMEKFEEAGTILHLGSGRTVSEQMLSASIQRLLDDFNARKDMSQKGRGLVDGKGVDRIISRILKDNK
jgi:UDP-2,4-diacetamido-2,4,6-trideoxy-beta-L-altropyranose hydrolase